MDYVSCDHCPLREIAHFKAFSLPELAFISNMKIDQIEVAGRTTIVEPGKSNNRLYTILSGWALRYRLTTGGQRQIAEVLLPGSLLGLQEFMLGHSEGGVESLGPVTLCVLEGNRMAQFFDDHANLGRAMTFALMEDQRRTDTRLMLVAQMPAAERLAYFLLETFDRLVALNQATGNWCYFPLQRRDLADILGLSQTHVSRSMQELRKRDLATVTASSLTIRNRSEMIAFSSYEMVTAHKSRLLL